MKNTNFRQAVFGLVMLSIVFAGNFSAQAFHTPTPSVSPVSPVSNTNVNTVPEATPETMPEMSGFPNYHPLVVHFPIVLLLVAALFQILAFFVYRKEFSIAVLIMIFLGTFSVWLASNVFHAHPKDLSAEASKIFEMHELLAQYTFWFALAATIAKVVSHFFTSRKWWSEAIVLAFLLAASITVSIAGHHGAQLVHIEGVGPQGKYLEHQH